MRKLLIALLALTTMVACEKENITPELQNQETATEYTELDNSESESRGFLDLVNVCIPGKFGLPSIELKLTKFSAKLKQKYFDAAVDLDGDGYYDKENDCSDLPVDCDDSDPNITESCYCVDDAIPLTVRSEIFVCDGTSTGVTQLIDANVSEVRQLADNQSILTGTPDVCTQADLVQFLQDYNAAIPNSCQNGLYTTYTIL